MKGHSSTKCPIAISRQPQTPEGIKVYGKYCADHNIIKSYDIHELFKKYNEKQKRFDNPHFAKMISNNNNSNSNSSKSDTDDDIIIVSEDEFQSINSHSPAPRRKKLNMLKIFNRKINDRGNSAEHLTKEINDRGISAEKLTNSNNKKITVFSMKEFQSNKLSLKHVEKIVLSKEKLL